MGEQRFALLRKAPPIPGILPNKNTYSEVSKTRISKKRTHAAMPFNPEDHHHYNHHVQECLCEEETLHSEELDIQPPSLVQCSMLGACLWHIRFSRLGDPHQASLAKPDSAYLCSS